MNRVYKIQQKVQAIKKDSVNPYYESKYFDINSLLEVLKPLFYEEELLVLQPLSNVDGKPALTTLVLDGKDGKEIFSSTVVLPENSDPQKMGSTITYFRRYALQSLFLLQAEDDDGHSAVDRTLMNNPASKREYPKTAKPTYDSNSKEAKIWIDIPFEGVADLKALKLEWAKWNPDRGQWSCFDSPENRSKLKGLQQVKALKTDSGEEITL